MLPTFTVLEGIFDAKFQGNFFSEKIQRDFSNKIHPFAEKGKKIRGVSHVKLKNFFFIGISLWKLKVSSIFWWFFFVTLKGISIWNCTEIEKMEHPGFEPETSDFLFTCPNYCN